MDALTDFVYCT